MAALPAPVLVVATFAEAGDALDRDFSERLVVVGPDVGLADALLFTSATWSEHPTVGVIVIRHTLELAEIQQAIRSGARDVLDTADLAGLSAACTRSLELSTRTLGVARTPFEGTVDGKILTVFSAKGGCGKTTIASNLSVALNNGGAARVCLVDLDLAFGDVAITLQLQPLVTIVDALALSEPEPANVSSILTNFRPNHDCLLAPVAPGDAEKIPATLTTTLLGVLSRMYDYVVVDTPSQFSEHVLAALDASDYHILITTPELPSLKNLRLTLDMLDLLGYSRDSRSVVLNRADENVGLTIVDVERVVKSPLAVHVPSSRDVPASINRGTPLTLEQPQHPVSTAIRRLAAERFASEQKKFAPEPTVTGKHRAIALSGLRRRRRTP